MKINWNDFDVDSKRLAKDLTKENEKFSNLINKLQESKKEFRLKNKLDKAFSEDIK